MASNHKILELAESAAAQAAASGPKCPFRPDLPIKYHTGEVCRTKPSRPPEGHTERRSIYNKLLAGGAGASLVPDAQTVICPPDVLPLESGGAKGFDTTWIVENTSTKPVVLAWIVGGVPYSPFTPDLSPLQDPKATLLPGDWTSVPTFESFVYHVYDIDVETGQLGDVLLQHRAGMVPLGRTVPKENENRIDPEPFDPKTVGTEEEPKPQAQEAGRGPPKKTEDRPCNVIDIGFRNEAGFPLSVYWANHLEDVPLHGFNCAEKYKFHMGMKSATQDFMWDWASKTKYEGALIGHTFVARKADDPSVVVDKYTLEPTRIIDCPKRKQKLILEVPPQTADAVADVVAEDGESCLNGDAERRGTHGDAEREGVGIVPPGEEIPSRSAGGSGISGGSK